MLVTLVIVFLQACFLLKESTGRRLHADVFIGRSNEKQCDCGTTYFNPGRTIGNNTVKNRREYPWMVGMLYDGKIICGGSLIDTSYVLTAAHCLDKLVTYDNAPEDVKHTLIKPHIDIVLNVPDKSHRLVTVGIAEYFVHPDYDKNKGKALNDIGIVRLKKTVIYTKWLKPICIAVNPKMTKVGKLISVLGFGNATDIHRSTVLREIALPIKKLDECRKALKTDVLETAICSGGVKDVDVCTGDSGGPMFYTDYQNRSYQVGIISWGDGCGKEDVPAMYTRINSFVKWIRDTSSDSPSCEQLFPPKVGPNYVDCGIPDKFCTANVSNCDSGEYSYSWMARIFYKKKFLGSGVLVNRTFVLTSTTVLRSWRSINRTSDLRVVLGMRLLSTKPDELDLDSSELECNVSDVRYHPNALQPVVILKLNIKRYDVVLLHHPLCMPDPRTKLSQTYGKLILMFWSEKKIKSNTAKKSSKYFNKKTKQKHHKRKSSRKPRHTVQKNVSELKKMVLKTEIVEVVRTNRCRVPNAEGSRVICGIMKGKEKCHGKGAVLMNYVGGRFFMMGFVSPSTKRCTKIKKFMKITWNYNWLHDKIKKMKNKHLN